MSVGNTRQSWGLVSRAFHWAMLAMIAVQIPLGFWMVEVYEVYAETYGDDTWVMRTSNWHHTLGFLVLATVCARLSWRALQTTPALTGLSSLQIWAARLTHVFLYGMLFIYPLSGWAALSAYEGEFPIFFFGFDSMPRVVPQVAEDAQFNYEFFAEIHRWCWRVGAALLTVHVSAALWHHYIARDGVLRRMLRGE
ncbi:MAG: cytochrome b [Gammaproteobacteria bacterium]|nr:cytochrome b [Gammaproteobacteria bacterium]